MKIKNRIFLYNTLMVLVSLIILLIISGFVISIFKNEYIDKEKLKSKPNEYFYEVQELFEFSGEELFDYEGISHLLAGYGYDLYVLEDGENIYSNLEVGSEEVGEYLKERDFGGKHATVYTQNSMTIVGKTLIRNSHEYVIVAIHSGNEEIKIGTISREFETFLLDFIIIGIATILVTLGISQLFTRKLVKRITTPIDQLVEAAKRVEKGDLENSIQYKGESEFETVCDSFNHMQEHLLDEKKKNASYELARTDMITGISHDLRTPLTSVKGYIKGIKDGIATTPEKRDQYLDIAYSKACEMDVLLQKLFYFSKIETGNMPFYMQTVKLNDFLANIVECCNEDLKTRGAKIIFLPANDIHFVQMDVEQMNRVFHNLIENSLKYANVESVQITLSVKEENNRKIITVSDNGKGIEIEKLPHLFEQFYRGDESRSQKNSDGNGLGLYIAKYVVEAHKGTISAENDNGFKIIISLPKEDFDIL